MNKLSKEELLAAVISLPYAPLTSLLQLTSTPSQLNSNSTPATSRASSKHQTSKQPCTGNRTDQGKNREHRKTQQGQGKRFGHCLQPLLPPIRQQSLPFRALLKSNPIRKLNKKELIKKNL